LEWVIAYNKWWAENSKILPWRLAGNPIDIQKTICKIAAVPACTATMRAFAGTVASNHLSWA
jgi:hypothetical protein